jgi:hypothetical protein
MLENIATDVQPDRDQPESVRYSRRQFACTGERINLDYMMKCLLLRLFSLSLFLSLFFQPQLQAQDNNVFIREHFQNLENWRPLYFPKIKKHSRYAVVKEDEKTYLKAESNTSASAIVYKQEFNIYEYPRMKWRWKIENIYQKGNVREKAGDDYPIRIYIMFKYDPEKASFGQKIKYGLAKNIYGEYPPHSTLNYIWANSKDEVGIVSNSYADEAKMIILQSGPDRSGLWQEEDVNMLDDYRKAFGTDPPAIAGIAIMNDSDNTGEHSVSYIDYMEVYK